METETADNLLYFVASNFDTLDRQHLHTLLVDTYKLYHLLASKSTLINECGRIDITDAIAEFKKKRLKAHYLIMLTANSVLESYLNIVNIYIF